MVNDGQWWCNRDDHGILGYSWIYLGQFHHDLNQRLQPIDDGLDIGESSPFMAEQFKLVKYYNLPGWDGGFNWCEKSEFKTS